MTATLEAQAEKMLDAVESLHPDVLVDGHEPEGRATYFGLSWERYLALDKALGDDRSGPLFCYLDGALEITTTSGERERVKRWIGGFVDLYLDEAGVNWTTRGQATMRLALESAGAEPDESWCIGEEKEFPDLVFEVALSSGGLSKLELYRRFAVPEVWFWRKGSLEVHALLPDGSGYERLGVGSRLLPALDLLLLERCVKMTNVRAARQAFRAGLARGAK